MARAHLVLLFLYPHSSLFPSSPLTLLLLLDFPPTLYLLSFPAARGWVRQRERGDRRRETMAPVLDQRGAESGSEARPVAPAEAAIKALLSPCCSASEQGPIQGTHLGHKVRIRTHAHTPMPSH